MNSEKHASLRMAIFLGVILVASFGIGAFYFFTLTPGNPGSGTLHRPQDGTLEQQRR